MKWLKQFKKIWKGQFLEEEIKRSEEATKEAQQVIKHTRAVLDGEDFWFLHCDRIDRDVSK